MACHLGTVELHDPGGLLLALLTSERAPGVKGAARGRIQWVGHLTRDGRTGPA